MVDLKTQLVIAVKVAVGCGNECHRLALEAILGDLGYTGNIVAHTLYCLTAWPHPNVVREEIRRKPTTLYRTPCIVHDEGVFVNTKTVIRVSTELAEVVVE